MILYKMLTKKEKKEREISFCIRDNLETRQYLNFLRSKRSLSKFMNEAVEFYYDYCFYQKGFLVRLIENNFYLCKHILRQLGGKFKNAKMSSL